MEDNSFQLNYEINYGFELSIPPGCDQTECRRLNYFRLVPNYTVVPEEVWPKGKKVEKRYFRGIDSSTKLPMFGNSSSSVTCKLYDQHILYDMVLGRCIIVHS